MKRLVHLHHYRALLRSLFIAVFIGVAGCSTV
ncbi:putative voltage-gated ClC-type chloride channel ClcB [Serratia sp. SCBI]|nr:putative voltage-gated ClC-type chloride channel ClcB [Serratia sp. SCBI]